MQFGLGGPEFEFDLDPRPAGAVRPTRVADAASLGSALPLTREASPASASNGGGVGRATVETMLAQSRQKTGLWIALASIAVVALLVAAVFAIPATRKLFTGKTGTGTTLSSLTPKEIAADNHRRCRAL